MQSLWSFLNSNLGILLLGFVLTTVAGSLIANRFDRLAWEREASFEAKRQNFEWERDKRFEILKRKLDEGQASLEEISNLMNLRFFRLQNVFEKITAGDLVSAEASWNSYFETVEQWNTKLITNQNKLERLVSPEASAEFNNYETDSADLTAPVSIHGRFFVAHQQVLALLRCLQSSDCEPNATSRREASQSLRALDVHSDAFIDRVSGLFLDRAYDLEEFSAPEAI